MHSQVLYFKIWMINEDVHDNIMQRILVLISKPTYGLHILQCLASMHHWYLHALMGFTHVSQEHIVELRFIMSFECVCFKTILSPLYHSKMLGRNNKLRTLSNLMILHGGSIKVWGGVISKLFWELVAIFWHNQCLVYIYKLALAHVNHLGMLQV